MQAEGGVPSRVPPAGLNTLERHKHEHWKVATGRVVRRALVTIATHSQLNSSNCPFLMSTSRLLRRWSELGK